MKNVENNLTFKNRREENLIPQRFISKREKIDFIADHREEIAPLVENNPQLIEILDEIIKPQDERKGNLPDVLFSEDLLDGLIEIFQTKVYSYEKPEGEYEPNAQRIFITASERMASDIMFPIIERLKQDRRCKAIGLLADVRSNIDFEKKQDTNFKSIQDQNIPIMADISKIIKEEPFDIIIASPDKVNMTLFSGKSVLGARKLYIITGGWIGLGSGNISFDPKRRQNMDDIDGIFCNNELAGRVLKNQLAEFSEDKIFPTGTPIIDGIENDKAEEYEREGRKKLGLDDKQLAVLYLGDGSNKMYEKLYGSDRQICEKTAELTVDSIIKLAEAEPQREFALLLRPHPNDPNKDEFLNFLNKKAPKNLKIIYATNREVSMQEATYAADVIISMVGTDIFLAPMKGKKSAFLGYKGKGMGGEMLEQIYSKEVLEIIKNDADLTVASSPEDLSAFIKKQNRSKMPVAKTGQANDSVEKIINIIFSEAENNKSLE